MTLRTLFAAITLITASAAQAYNVKATVVDTIGEFLPYVTYRIFPDSATVATISGTSTELGEINQAISQAGNYRLTLSYVGMVESTTNFTVGNSQATADLGTLTMTDDTQQLENITVTAQRPLVVKKIDRLEYDVTADPTAPTSTLNQILRKVPMVSVDPDGTIKVNGSTNFKIYKNGRPSNSLSRNAKDLFAALPASMIKRIEVITEPGAEYDAEGTTAILNIVTDNHSSIKGVLGNVSTYWSTDMKTPSVNTWITSEIDKVTFNVYGGFNPIGGTQSKTRNESRTDYPGGISRIGNSNSRNDGDLEFFGLDASYQPDTLNLITAEISGYAYDVASRGSAYEATIGRDADGTEQTLGSFRSTTDNPYARYLDFDAAVNFQHNTHRKGEVYTLSYLISHTNQSSRSQTYYSDFTGSEQLPYSAILAKYNLSFYEHTLQADWTRQLGIHNLDFGVKGIFRRNHSTNEFEYTGMGTADNEFRHNTDIAAVYGQYSVALGRVNLRAGLRYEYSHMKASYPDGSEAEYSANLNDLVPSAAISWSINDANSLTANYSTSISRPGINFLNPAITLSPTNKDYGNPDLGSARRQSAKLTYMLIKNKFNFQLSADYAFINNGIAAVRFLDDNNIINSTYQNIGHERNLTIGTFMQWSPTEKTQFMLQGHVTYARFSQLGMSLSRWSPFVFTNIQQKLPWNLQSSIYFFYHGGQVNDVYQRWTQSFSSGSYYGISLSRAFLKDDRLNVRAELLNPISPKYMRLRNEIVNGDYTGYNNTYIRRGIQARISVSFRFGSLKTQVKKTSRSIENDDLIGRKTE